MAINSPEFILLTVLLIGAVFIWAPMAYHHYLRKERRYTVNLQHRIDIVELFASLDFIIKVETDIYEQILETNSTINWVGLTNTEFINIYNELAMRCLKAISSISWEMFDIYIKRETVQTYVTQKVMQYLMVKTERDDIEEE